MCISGYLTCYINMAIGFIFHNAMYNSITYIILDKELFVCFKFNFINAFFGRPLLTLSRFLLQTNLVREVGSGTAIRHQILQVHAAALAHWRGSAKHVLEIVDFFIVFDYF